MNSSGFDVNPHECVNRTCTSGQWGSALSIACKAQLWYVQLWQPKDRCPAVQH